MFSRRKADELLLTCPGSSEMLSLLPGKTGTPRASLEDADAIGHFLEDAHNLFVEIQNVLWDELMESS